MARLGILTSEFPASTLDGVLDALLDHGVTTAQLQLVSAMPEVPLADGLMRGLDVLGERFDEGLANRIRVSSDRHGVELAAIDGTYNMVHPDRDRRMRNLRHLQTLIALAPRMGSRTVTLCTGSRNEVMWSIDPANHDESAWADLIGQLRAATRTAETEGVTLAFEPEHSNVVDSAARARRLIDEVGSPALKVLFDPANIFHTGDLARMRSHLEEAVALLARDIALVHAKDLDRDGAAGGLAAGRGLLDYPFLLRLLQRSGYDGPIVLHGLHDLDAAGIDESLALLRVAAPEGYLS